MNITITSDYEFLEVLRAFPVLKRTLVKDFHFDLTQADTDDTVGTYFRKQSLSPEEVRIVIRKMNHRLKTFFNTPIMYSSNNQEYYDQDALDEEE